MLTLKSKFIFLLLMLSLKAVSQPITNAIELEYQNDRYINDLGIGLIQNVKAYDDIILYTDSTCSKIFTKKAILGKELIPLLYKPDYDILYIICYHKSLKFYQVKDLQDNIYYIKPSASFKFYSWDTFIKNNAVSMSPKDSKSNLYRETIDGKPIDVKTWRDDEYDFLEIKGDWVKIKNINRDRIFWVKWRNCNKLLVYINLLM